MSQAAQIQNFSRIAPASKVLFTVAFSCVIACLNNLLACICAFAMVCLICFCAKVPLKKSIYKLGSANLFILLIWLFASWSTPGEPLWNWGIFSPTKTGCLLCLQITIKANAIILIFLALISPMSVTALANALAQLHVPDKMIWLLLIMGKNIELVGREWDALKQAAKLRCFRARNNPHTYKTLASMLAILLVRSYDRAQKMREAMLLRSFSGKLPLTSRWICGYTDLLLALFFIFSSGVLIYLEFSDKGLF